MVPGVEGDVGVETVHVLINTADGGEGGGGEEGAEGAGSVGKGRVGVLKVNQGGDAVEEGGKVVNGVGNPDFSGKGGHGK